MILIMMRNIAKRNLQSLCYSEIQCYQVLPKLVQVMPSLSPRHPQVVPRKCPRCSKSSSGMPSRTYPSMKPAWCWVSSRLGWLLEMAIRALLCLLIFLSFHFFVFSSFYLLVFLFFCISVLLSLCLFVFLSS